MITLSYHTINHLKIGNNTTEGIEDGVKDQALKRSLGIPLRSRDTLHDSMEDLIYTEACLPTSSDDLFTLAAQ